VSKVLKLASLSLVVLLTLAPAFAKPKAAEPTKPAEKVCVTPDAAKEKIKKGKIEADLTGDDLKRFHANYARLTKHEPPADVDRLLVVSYPETPEVFFVLIFKAGCVAGLEPIEPSTFKKINGADDGSV
jgi:hypothetical protein